MVPNRLFQITLLVSFCTHGVILFHSTRLDLSQRAKDTRQAEITYVKMQDEVQNTPQRESITPERMEQLSMTVSAEQAPPPPFTSEAQDFAEKEGVRHGAPNVNSEEFITKPVFDKTDVITIRKKISLPAVDQDEKIDNPAYVTYYQMVRERIKRSAYRAYTGREQGDVMLSFIISSEGELKVIKLIEEKSAPSDYLRTVADRSVRSASPFPPFPKEVNYAELSFNIAITFEVE